MMSVQPEMELATAQPDGMLLRRNSNRMQYACNWESQFEQLRLQRSAIDVVGEVLRTH